MRPNFPKYTSKSKALPHQPNPTSSRILSTYALRTALVLASIFLCCVYYAKTHFYRDPGSRFYDDARAFERRYSAFREEQTKTYLNNVRSDEFSGNGHIKADENATVCAAFLTIVRSGVEPYLDASIASALDRLTPEERRTLRLTIFFATTKPDEHPTYTAPWLRKVVDEVVTYDSLLLQEQMENIRNLEAAHDPLTKAPYDYAITLQHCAATGAKYIALFEDDIVLAEGWLARTLLGLKEVEKQMEESGREDQWLYLRLFNQERSTGWVSKKIGGNREAKFSIQTAAGISVFLLLLRWTTRQGRKYVDYSVILTFILFTPAFVILFFLCGKASLMPPPAGVQEEAFGCCAQGLVFNAHHAEALTEYLQLNRLAGYHDLLTQDFALMHQLAMWSQYPMVVQHVGTKSTIQKIAGESRHVWSMAFEDLDPWRLGREHGEDVRRLFG